MALLCLTFFAISPAFADDESEFRARPTAALAEKIARAALSRDQPAKAMNWLERIGAAPGATLAQLNWVTKQRADLKWRLNDAHVAPVQIRVNPSSADVVIDGLHVPFHTAMHTLWLPEGAHSLEVIAVDHATQTLSIGARLGEREVYEVSLEMSRPPVLQVHLQPDGEVWVDGTLLGSSTKGRFVVSSGRHLVEMRAPNSETWQQEVALKSGDVKALDIRLKPTVAAQDPALARRAHQIDRPLLPSEVAEQKEHGFAKIEVASGSLDKGLGQRVSGDAASPESQRKAREATAAEKKGALKPDEPKEVGQPKVVAPRGDENRTAEPEQRAVARNVRAEPDPRDTDNSVTEPAAPPSPGWSRTTKGWLYGGAGFAVLGAGLAMAYLGAQDAETANQLPRGSKTYADDYAAASGKAYLGYGAAGLGAVGVGVGAYYLFGNGGLSRKGKGWVVTTLGALTAAAGGWLMLDAASLASTTDQTLSPKSPEYTRRFDLAERNRWVGIGVAGAGAAIIGTGLALVLTGSSSSAQAEPSATERPALAWQFQPLVGNGVTGGSVHLAW